MRKPGVPLTMRPAWKALETHHARLRDVHLRTLFAEDPGRGERLTAEAAGLYLDYSKHRVTPETMRLLVALAQEVGLGRRIEAMLIRRYRQRREGRGRTPEPGPGEP